MVAVAQLPALFQHQNVVRVENGADPLGDDDGGDALVLLPQGFPQGGVGAVVQGGRGVVQNEDLRGACQGPGHQHPLLLAAAEVGALGGEHVLQAVGQGGDKVHGLGAPGGLFNVLGGQVPAEVDVLVDGVREQHVVLEHHAELLVKFIQRDGGKLPAADLDQPGVGVVQPHEQGHQGGLAAACCPDDAQGLPGLQPEADVLHAGFRFAVREGHVVKHHVVGGILRLHGRDAEVLRRFQHLLNPGPGGDALGAHDEDPGDGHHGVQNDGEVA